jgi:soluble lytic murein transglycosylase-like protein
MAPAQPASATAATTPSSTRSAAEALAQKQRKATLAAMQASVDKQRASVAGGLAASIGKSPAKSKLPTPDAFFTLPPMPPLADGAIPADIQTATQPGLYCDPVSETDLAPIVLDAAQREGLEPRLLTAVIEQESAFRPCAVSQKGAQGLMQLMPATAEQFGVSDPFDIQQNIGGGARFLKELLTRYTGDLALALGAYNAGPTKVDEAGAVPAIPETTNYVREILRKLAPPPADPKPAVE